MYCNNNLQQLQYCCLKSQAIIFIDNYTSIIHMHTYSHTAYMPLSNTDAPSVQSFLNFGCRIAAAMFSASHMFVANRRTKPASIDGWPHVWTTSRFARSFSCRIVKFGTTYPTKAFFSACSISRACAIGYITSLYSAKKRVSAGFSVKHK